MKLSRQIGTVSQIANIFIQDATVSTGAGLANIIASSVSFTLLQDIQAAISTGTCTSGTLGTFSSATLTQVSSSNALGWYQFGIPNGALAAGSCSLIHIYGAPSMAPLPIEMELTKTNNQQYASSTVFLAHTSTSPANIVQIQGQNAVTSSAGTLNGRTQAIDKTGYNATTTVNLDKTAYSLTAAEEAAIAGTVLTTTQPEAYRASSAVGSIMQLQYEMLANLIEFSNSGTTRTLQSITSHAATALTYGYDSSTTPSSISRTA